MASEGLGGDGVDIGGTAAEGFDMGGVTKGEGKGGERFESEGSEEGDELGMTKRSGESEVERRRSQEARRMTKRSERVKGRET